MAKPVGSWLEVDEWGNVKVARIICQSIIDEGMIQTLNRQLLGLIEDVERPRIVLNFDKVKYLASAMLGKLVRLFKQVQAGEGKLALCCLNPELYKIFEMTSMHKLFAIYSKEEEALKAV